MAVSLDTLSLSQLLDVSIGMPQMGTVHFAALRKLLQAVLEHLDVQYLTTEEPWPGHLSGPSLADLAAEVKEMKKEIEINNKQIIEMFNEEIGRIKAELSSFSEDISNIQKEQSHMAENIKKLEAVQDEEKNLIQDLREEIDRMQTAQIYMEADIKKTMEALPLMKKMGEDLKKLREDTTNWKEEISKEISQQIEAVLQETKNDLQRMEEQQEMKNAMLEQMVTETAKKLNEQLGDAPETSESQEEEEEEESGGCTGCKFNVRACLMSLLKSYEKVQEQVDCLESRHIAMVKLKRIIRNWGQDQERFQRIETTLVQIQGDCKKLSLDAGKFQRDSQQKQKAIKMLFQSVEKLQKEKADEQDMWEAMDLKVDRAALGRKVNCSQFEAVMEQLDKRMQELQNLISEQKEHWEVVQEQFSDAMDEKLDRQELKTFSDQIEETWNRNIEELENRLMRESAAGIKKQLPVPFSCLSCDRMLTMHVPGPYPETLPYLQPMPPSKDPQHSQRRPVVHGSVSRVLQSSGDHQGSSSTLQHINASLQRTGQPPVFLTVPSKLSVNQVLDSSGQTSKGQDDQRFVVITKQDDSGPAASQDHQPGTAPRRIS